MKEERIAEVLEVRPQSKWTRLKTELLMTSTIPMIRKLKGGGKNITVARSIRPVVSNSDVDNKKKNINGAGRRGKAVSVGRRDGEDGFHAVELAASSGWISALKIMGSANIGETNSEEAMTIGEIISMSRGRHLQVQRRGTSQNTNSTNLTSTPLNGARKSPAAAEGVPFLFQLAPDSGGSVGNSGNEPSMNVNGANNNSTNGNAPNYLGMNIDDGKLNHANKPEGTISSSDAVGQLLASESKQRNQEGEIN